MQLGNLLVVPPRRPRRGSAPAVAGRRPARRRRGAYLLAKVVKGIVVRGRPDDLLADVVIRGAEAHGRGFVSGHAAVATALVVVACPDRAADGCSAPCSRRPSA